MRCRSFAQTHENTPAIASGEKGIITRPKVKDAPEGKKSGNTAIWQAKAKSRRKHEMNTKRNTKSTSAKTRKITAEDAALMKRYAEVCAKSRRERAEWERKHPYRAVRVDGGDASRDGA